MNDQMYVPSSSSKENIGENTIESSTRVSETVKVPQNTQMNDRSSIPIENVNAEMKEPAGEIRKTPEASRSRARSTIKHESSTMMPVTVGHFYYITIIYTT